MRGRTFPFNLFVLLLLVTISSVLLADTLVSSLPLAVKDEESQEVYAFDLRDIHLLGSPFKSAMELDARYLLSLEPDRLLSRYREFAGLESKAEAYGGWERATISGHSLGHYLTAVSKLYASTTDERILERVNYIVDELARCQKAWGNGFVGGFPRSQEVFAEIKEGNIRTAGFDLNGLWVPWYNLHKLYMGLVDANLYCGNVRAKDVLIASTDWAWDVVGALTDEQFEKMLHCEHGGINEAFAEIYALTGHEKALKLAERFYHHRVLDPLSRKEDNLTGLHSNTQIPKLIGLARLYRLTGKEKYNTASSFFWHTVVENRTYVNGGNTDGEYFFPPEQFSKHLSVHTTETCNTHNMLKLTRQLFAMDPSCKHADYYERALYNHILASQDPKEGMMIYFCPLKGGHFKTYNKPFDSFWCCTGTGMENHVKYGDSIYFHDDDALYVNLFIPSVLKYHEKNLTVIQETAYPLDGQITLQFMADRPVELTVNIRRPIWAEGDVELFVNGEPRIVRSGPGRYITIKRTWKGSEQVRVVLPMELRTESMPDNPNKVAFFYGPVLLAGALGTDGIEDLDPHAGQRAEYDHIPTPATPIIVAESEQVTDHIKVSGDQGTFMLDGSVLRIPGRERAADMTLIPFYKTHYQRYMVYWDLFTKDRWDREQAEFEAKLAETLARQASTIDHIVLGQMQPERDHGFKGEKTEKGLFQNRHWRDARSGGWFSFEMKVAPDAPVELSCLYWGSDGPGRDFDILIDDKKIATVHLNQNQPGRFFNAYYDVPAELTSGKSKVSVKFKPHSWRHAGPLYECRIMKKQ